MSRLVTLPQISEKYRQQGIVLPAQVQGNSCVGGHYKYNSCANAKKQEHTHGIALNFN